MRGSAPVVLLAIALSGCASQDQALRRRADRAAPDQKACPQPTGAEQAQAALSGAAHRFDSISSNETRAFGPTRIIWVHPPDDLLESCR